MVGRSTLELGMSKESAKRVFELAKETGALLYGDFVLSSGKKSDHYFEGKRLTLSPEGAYQVGVTVLDLLADANVDAVGGLATGAFPIATAVSLISRQRGKPIPSFIVREEQKKHGTQRQIEGFLREGSRVAIVDDVITAGGSVNKAIEAVEALNCKVVAVIVIVDRHEGGSDSLKERGYNLTSIIDLKPSGDASLSNSSVARGGIKAGV